MFPNDIGVSQLMALWDKYEVYVHYVLRIRLYVYSTWNDCYMKING